MTVNVGDEVYWVAGHNSAGYSWLKVHKIEDGIVHASGYSDGEDAYQTSSITDWEKFAVKDGVIKR
jgi:hypothetical protein